VRSDGVANDDKADLEPLMAPKPPPNEEPNVLPPKEDLVAPPRAPKPLAGAAGAAVLPANDPSLLLDAAPNGELDPGLASPPNGDADLARLPNPDALNLSSEVWGSNSGRSDDLGAWGLGDMAAKGEAAEVFAKPLPGGI
jgi:hypothetical protein